MSKRLIDANELISAMYYYEHNEGGLTAYDAQDIINKAPTIEPKRGEWLWDNGYFCSECQGEAFSQKFTMLIDDPLYFRSDFCPNCGADLRGRHNE